MAQPVIDGQVRIENAVYSSDSLPVGIEAMNGDIAISGNRVDITNLTANAGGGTITSPAPPPTAKLPTSILRCRQTPCAFAKAAFAP